VDLINKERGGAMVDKALIRSCIEVYEKMGMGTLDAYVADFEAQLLAATRCVYIWLCSRSCGCVHPGNTVVHRAQAGCSPDRIAYFICFRSIQKSLFSARVSTSVYSCPCPTQDVLRGQSGELDRGGQRSYVHDPRGEGPGGGAPARGGLPQCGDGAQAATGAFPSMHRQCDIGVG
jgi:hypothetical protein